MSPASLTRSNDQTANTYTAMANIEPRATAKQGGKGGESENGFGQCPSSLSRTKEPYTSPQTANDRIDLTITKIQPSPLQKKEPTSPKPSDRKDLGSLFHKKTSANHNAPSRKATGTRQTIPSYCPLCKRDRASKHSNKYTKQKRKETEKCQTNAKRRTSHSSFSQEPKITSDGSPTR